MSLPDVTCGPASPLADARGDVERRLASGEFFWLDVHAPSDDDAAALAGLLGLHDLAAEDLRKFGQRPKVDDYDGFALIVAYGAADDDDRVVEVHCLYSERFMVTVHHDDCAAFREMHRRHDGGRPAPIRLLHLVIDVLTDSFFPVLQEFDDAIDALEEDLVSARSRGIEQRIFALKRRLVAMRKVVGPQRDMVARLAGTGLVDLPGMDADAQRYFRDVYDHLIRLGDQIDNYRDLLSGATDVHLSTVSNRLNEVTKQLAVVATVFLPLTFITGFFGQNFGWMVRHIGGWGSFLLLGIGIQVGAVLLLLAWFRRKGWLQ